MSEPAAAPSAWPAARPTGISPIQHPAWEEARNAVLDLAAAGPFTAIIVGEPGTGKSWLLRELAAALGDHGFPTMLLMQGNLPISLSDGAALLVDDASLMDIETRAEISAQQHGIAILAGAEWFEDELDAAASPTPVIIPLRTLEPAEIATFAAEWLQRSGMPDSTIGPAMLSRLTAGSSGRVELIVRLLGEAATAWQRSPILAVTEIRAEIRAKAIPERPVEAPIDHPVQVTVPRRRRAYPLLLGGTAIAATIVLGWALMPAPPVASVTQRTASLPPIHQADTHDPDLATAAVPALLAASAPAPAAFPLPGPDAPALLATAAIAPPAVVESAEPVLVATLDDPALDIIAPTRPTRPGLVLIAQRGDTLQSLYGDIYRDRNAPPFATVVAANPRPFKPGAIVVFPEPPGGWQRVQR